MSLEEWYMDRIYVYEQSLSKHHTIVAVPVVNNTSRKIATLLPQMSSTLYKTARLTMLGGTFRAERDR